MNKNILTSLGPNYEKDDVLLASKLLFSLDKYKDDISNIKLEKRFESLYGKKYKALTVNSGRSALYLILKAMGIGSGDEVLLQSFTCIAVPNSINWIGAKPIYVDISDNFNIDSNDLSKKISKKSKALIVQHTFGRPADMSRITKLCRKHKLLLIEDCAHSLGATYKSKLVGSFGDASFFSFGRDKTISSVFGGMIITKDQKLYKRLKVLRDDLNYPSYFWTFQQLMHPILMSIIKPTYNIGLGKLTIGKLVLFLSQKLNLLSFPVYEIEKRGKKPDYFPLKMSGALSELAINQLNKLPKFVNHRKKIAKIYRDSLNVDNIRFPEKSEGESLLRFPLIIRKRDDIYDKFKNEGVLLGSWYKNPIDPAADEKVTEYKAGSCQNTENISKRIINLPTNIEVTEEVARYISYRLNKWLK